MNYGVAASTIIPGTKFQSFYDDCRYEQLKKSLPHFVFLSFGAMDTHLKHFTQEKFVESYIKLIKDVQSLPTKPMVFLMVPVFTCAHKLNLETPLLADWTLSTSECTDEQKQDL